MVDGPELALEHATIEPRTGSSGADPAVVVSHGRGADEEDLLPVAQRLPDELRVISLRAPQRLMGGYTWYELDLSAGGLHESQPDDADFRESLALIEESISDAVDAYGLDPERIGLLGFSQGAIMSMSLLLEEPRRYAWVVALHGYLPASHADLEPDDIEGKPAFLAAGTRDDIIPADRVAAAAERLEALGCAVTFERYETQHGIGDRELADVIDWVERRIEG